MLRERGIMSVEQAQVWQRAQDETSARREAEDAARQATDLLPVGQYTLADGTVLAITPRREVVDAWGNFCFPSHLCPTIEALENQWQDFCSCEEE